jgi:cellulose synthase/poly-beta-1,6-N-acetylglucosamine synthase-like glycosyltransferase
MKNGKVRGVLTGLRAASHDLVVLADEDVRYTPDGLAEMARALGTADVVRPQNYFISLPWHARVDTARMLINRETGAPRLRNVMDSSYTFSGTGKGCPSFPPCADVVMPEECQSIPSPCQGPGTRTGH